MIKRYLLPYVSDDLKEKAVLLSGARQVGKSTFAKSLLDSNGYYYNWDIRKDKSIVRQGSWPKNSSLVVLDELHKFTQWKNFLKGVLDEYGNTPPLLITGSAKLDIFRRGGDALTGRTYHYRLHPVDLSESSEFLPNLDLNERLNRLLATGGFPEAVIHPRNAERLRNDRFDLVIREDLRDLSNVTTIRTIELLVELLRERVGGQINYSNIASDLSVSPPTVKKWIEILEKLYIVFLIYPYHKGAARALRKEPKLYFYDCAGAFEEKGSRLENLVACTLLKYCHLCEDVYGIKARLWYFRDRDGREVDFIVTERNKIKFCIEVKESDDTPHKPLTYLANKLNPDCAIQLVRNLEREREINEIRIMDIACWLDGLYRTQKLS